LLCRDCHRRVTLQASFGRNHPKQVGRRILSCVWSPSSSLDSASL
jgi:hypothetical protein